MAGWDLPVTWSVVHTPSAYDVWADPDGDWYLARNTRSGHSLGAMRIFERVMNGVYGLCDQGSVVTINEGQYELGRDVDRITIPQHNITTVGKGYGYLGDVVGVPQSRQGVTVLRLKDSFGAGEYQAFTASGKQGLSFKEFTLDLNRYNQCSDHTGCARYLAVPDYTKFMHDGFKLTTCPQAYFEGLALRNILRNGIWCLSSSNNVQVVNCVAQGVEGGDHLWGNRAYGWGAIVFHQSSGGQVSGLYANDCGTAIVFYNSEGGIVTGHKLSYNGDGIYIWLGSGHTIGPGNYDANEGQPIRIVDATYCDISGGYYANNPDTGAYSEAIAIANTVQADGHHTVTGGVFRKCKMAVYCYRSNLNNFRLGTVDQNRTHAVYIEESDDAQVNGGLFTANGTAADDTYAHVHITNSDRAKVFGITARKGAKKPSYGVTVLEAASENARIWGSDLVTSGNLGSILDNGTGTDTTTVANLT